METSVAVRTVVRTEKKYSVTQEEGQIISSRLARVMRRDENGAEGGYLVRSLYFDSIYDNDYFDKVNGLECRKKIRLRIYAPDQSWVKLELKQKRGAAQVKRSLTISRETARQIIAGRYAALLSLDDKFAGDLYYLMKFGVYRPQCVVEYRREAFVDPTNDIRITIDADLRAGRRYEKFWDGDPGLHPLLRPPTLEVKYNGFLLDYCKGILGTAGLPELSLSKYEAARRAVG